MAGLAQISQPAAVMAYGLRDAPSWWDEVDESPLWQDRIFHVLAGLYAIVAAVALVIRFFAIYVLIFHWSFNTLF